MIKIVSVVSHSKTEGAELLIKDLQLKFGTADAPDKNCHTLGVMGDKTWSTVGLLAMGVIERLLAETEWAHAILKVQLFFAVSSL